MNKINISKIFTKILLSIIFILTSVIYIKLSDNNKSFYESIFINNSISFTKLNDLYNKYFGSVVPTTLDTSKSVVNETNNYTFIDNYLNGSILKVDNNYVTSLNSGIVVFIGEKEGYNKSIIIQGNDKVDILYGNIESTNLNLYDYVSKGQTISSLKDNTLYLVLIKDNNYLKYEEYKN